MAGRLHSVISLIELRSLRESTFGAMISWQILLSETQIADGITGSDCT